ncbi:MAG: hypothetical protein WCC66_03985 [Rhizobiaceae bacterium]
MWDFSISKTLGIMAQTMPFILFRMIVFFGITIAYIAATGTGGAVGYGVGAVSGDPDTQNSFALWGAFGGFGLVSMAVFWIREYVLYIVKAGHIAVMVELLQGKDLPHGRGQIDHAKAVVTERFLETNVLFAVDQLIKGVIGTITGLIGGIAAFLPIPGLDGLVRFINSVIRMSLTFVDEIILGYAIKTGSDNPWASGRTGIILYAQNGTMMVKNAIWLSIFMWIITIIVFLLFLAPAAGLLFYFPGQAGGWGFVIAIVFAWAFKAALLEPFAIAALMDVYFRAIEGQQPNAEWERRLEESSNKFRDLGQKAVDWFKGKPAGFPSASTGG